MSACKILFSNALKTKLNWSKNVTKVRDALWQVLFGSMVSNFCVLVRIAFWLEISLSRISNALLFQQQCTRSNWQTESKGTCANIAGENFPNAGLQNCK
jgi:cyclophilin family peptidyl-prolyl cis-trans isomerase